MTKKSTNKIKQSLQDPLLSNTERSAANDDNVIEIDTADHSGHGHHHHHHHSMNCASIDTTVNAIFGFIAQIAGITLDLGAFIDHAQGADDDDKEVFGAFTKLAFSIALVGALIAAVGSTYCHWVLNKNNESEATEKPKTRPLKWWQFSMLGGDALAHVNEVATPIIAVTELTSAHRFAKLSIAGLALLGGLWSSKADVRTCAQNLKTYNGAHVEEITEETELSPTTSSP